MFGTSITLGALFSQAQHELFLFAAFFFLLGAADEWAMDALYFFLRVTGRGRTRRIDEAELSDQRLRGPAVVFIPAWCEERVIEATLRHATSAWQHEELRILVGCYVNDPATLASVQQVAREDQRVQAVVHSISGPTDKADCLNRLYRALCEMETREGWSARMVVMHDAEDCVDPYALSLLDRAIDSAEFVQLPVMALPNSASPLIAGHYSDEFAEAHAKTMVVRSHFGRGVPGAGVGCAIARDVLTILADAQGGRPFAAGSLTEDYELGLNIAALGGRSIFMRARTKHGRLIATRAYFPSRIDAAVRQKTRWIHGVSLQSWDRLGWRGGIFGAWMCLRDRRGPFAAMLLAVAYGLILLSALGFLARLAGVYDPPPLDPMVATLLTVALAALLWRLLLRVLFTTREYGWRQGLLAILRTPVSNIIAIMAGRRAIAAYVRSLNGEAPRWDKTEHTDHPALSHPA